MPSRLCASRDLEIDTHFHIACHFYQANKIRIYPRRRSQQRPQRPCLCECFKVELQQHYSQARVLRARASDTFEPRLKSECTMHTPLPCLAGYHLDLEARNKGPNFTIQPIRLLKDAILAQGPSIVPMRSSSTLFLSILYLCDAPDASL